MEEKICFQLVFRNLSDKSDYNCLKIGHNNRSKVKVFIKVTLKFSILVRIFIYRSKVVKYQILERFFL